MRPLLKWRREGLLIVAGALLGAAIAIGVVYAADINGGSSSARAQQTLPPARGSLSATSGPVPNARAQDRDCPQWNVSTWDSRARIGQSNNWSVYFDFNQNGGLLQGPARATDVYGRTYYRGNVEGNVGRSPLLPTQRGFPASGVRGPAAINFVIRWSNGSIGIYTGKISNFGWGEGTTWDMRNPQSQARWILSPTAKCRSG